MAYPQKKLPVKSIHLTESFQIKIYVLLSYLIVLIHPSGASIRPI